MLIFVTGASGSGNTAVIPGLTEKFPEYAVHDFDERGQSDDADTRSRQEKTEFESIKGLKNNTLDRMRSSVVVPFMVKFWPAHQPVRLKVWRSVYSIVRIPNGFAACKRMAAPQP